MKAQEAFCRTCFKAVCIFCLLDATHKSHQVESLEATVQAERRNLNSYIVQLGHLHQRLKTEYESTELKAIEERNDIDKSVRMAKAWATELKQMIDKRVSAYESSAE